MFNLKKTSENILQLPAFKNPEKGECPVKKILVMFLSLLMALASCSCVVNDEEKAAITFISSYYAQYENKAEVKDLINSANPQSEIEAFITNNFDGLLTEKCRNTLVSNRIIPKFDVLESDIVKAVADDYVFSKADNEIDGTMKFNAVVSYEHEDGTLSTEEVAGLIRIIKENGRHMVDWFRFIQN